MKILISQDLRLATKLLCVLPLEELLVLSNSLRIRGTAHLVVLSGDILVIS